MISILNNKIWMDGIMRQVYLTKEVQGIECEGLDFGRLSSSMAIMFHLMMILYVSNVQFLHKKNQ